MRLMKMNTHELQQIVAKIPKAELHVRLEGAIPHEALLGLVKRKGDEDAGMTVEDLRAKMAYTDFPHFLQMVLWTSQLIKEESDFEDLVFQVLCSLAEQNIKYVELTYAPTNRWGGKLSVDGITEYILKGREKASKELDIRCNLIADLIRDRGSDEGMRQLEVLTPYLGRGLVGITIGGSEHEYPPGPFEDVYKEAKKAGFGLTVHAGEAAGAESVRDSVEKLGVERVGHATRAFEDPELVALLKERQIPLEMCVMSNVRTGAVESTGSHPIKDYYKQGLMLTINSDDPVMFNTTINEEYRVLVEHFDFQVDELEQISLNGVHASLLPAAHKADLEEEFKTQFARLRKDLA